MASIFQKTNFHFYNFNFHFSKNKLPFLQLQLPFFKKQVLHPMITVGRHLHFQSSGGMAPQQLCGLASASFVMMAMKNSLPHGCCGPRWIPA